VRQQKQTDVDGDGEGSDIEHENTDADTEGYSYKSGPVPQGAKDRLLKAQDDLAQIVEQMAVELNKPAHLLWQVIDAQPKGVRSPTAWNMFQTWLYAPTGGAQKHEKHCKSFVSMGVVTYANFFWQCLKQNERSSTEPSMARILMS
jgi:hypothetical protein